MGRNQVVLEGVLCQRDVLRFTPAGIAVLELRLKHSSRQVEANTERDVDVEMSVVAVGESAHQLAQVPVDTKLAIKGFLARRSAKSDYPVLHINQFKIIE